MPSRIVHVLAFGLRVQWVEVRHEVSKEGLYTMGSGFRVYRVWGLGCRVYIVASTIETLPGTIPSLKQRPWPNRAVVVCNGLLAGRPEPRIMNGCE